MVTEKIYRICQVLGGEISSHDVGIEFRDATHTHLLNDIKIVLYMGDEFGKRFIPECVDDDRYVFLDELFPKIYKPNIEDIERCYYTLSGIPQNMYKFYSGVVVVDSGHGESRYGSAPYFKNVLQKSIPSITKIF